jgi:polysaccharide biosynthesis/export protein
MKTSRGWSCWKTARAWLALALPCLLLPASGCAKDRDLVEKNLLAVRNSTQRHEGVDECYRVACPDVIELHVYRRPEFSQRYPIAIDGKIDLGEYGKVRVEGRTPGEIARLMAQEVGESAENVRARVVEFHSAHVLLFGEVVGFQRSIPYRGQETVLDLLQRVGGITVGAEPKDVYVVRPHLGDSLRPEVFHVDLHAIVVKHDYKTNLRILPFDQIYVGETCQAKLERALPPWIRTVCQTLGHSQDAPSPPRQNQDTVPSHWIEGDKVTR